jgi:hypothetical protein
MQKRPSAFLQTDFRLIDQPGSVRRRTGSLLCMHLTHEPALLCEIGWLKQHEPCRSRYPSIEQAANRHTNHIRGALPEWKLTIRRQSRIDSTKPRGSSDIPSLLRPPILVFLTRWCHLWCHLRCQKTNCSAASAHRRDIITSIPSWRRGHSNRGKFDDARFRNAG